MTLPNYIKKEDNEKNNECIYQGHNKIEKSYNELIRLYCYIKDNFRNILIQQFTTEQYYIEKSSEVFNSDTEFINKFNEFIDELVESRNGKDSLIFLFIDDIDLSTTRCVDVVRTLLSYLSNQRIVTFISGDMETFEEGLTLDFLRQEKALDEKVFKQVFFESSTEDDSLLQRKKRLAYEYLKKIIPPAYRYSIKYWSEEDRGNYLVDNDADEKKYTLRELLCETVGKKVGKSYFCYKKENEYFNFCYTYCMFDNTSRGLNNVYNILQKLYYIEQLEETEEKEQKKANIQKNLLETIIDSKPFYAKYKERILNEIIVFETDRVYVNIDKAVEFILGEKIIIEKEEKVACFGHKEQIDLFILLDFSIRLFEKEFLKTFGYEKIKKAIVVKLAKMSGFEFNSVKKGENIRRIEEIPLEYGFAPKYSFIPNFLLKGDFVFNLYFWKNYKVRNEIFLDNPQQLNMKAVYSLAISLAETIEELSGDVEEKNTLMLDIYDVFQEEINLMVEQLSLDKEIVFGNEILERLLPIIPHTQYYRTTNNVVYGCLEGAVQCIRESIQKKANRRRSDLTRANSFCKQARYWMLYETLKDTTLNPNNSDGYMDLERMVEKVITNGLIKFQSNLMKNFMNEFVVKNINKEEYRALIDNVQEKEWNVIYQIDKKKIWNNEYCEKTIKIYLESKITEECYKMITETILFDVSEIFSANGAYKNFIERENRQSRCLAYDLEKRLKEVIAISIKENDKQYMKLEQILVMQCFIKDFLDKHPRARYGKLQAKRLLVSLQELPIVIPSANEKEWKAVIGGIEESENAFFKGKFEEKQESIMTKGKNMINEVKREFDKSQNLSLQQLVKKKLEDYPEYQEKIYNQLIQYIVCESKILDLQRENSEEGMLNESDKKKINVKEIQFCLHGYMKYLQANSTNLADIGKRADIIVEFTELLVKSGVLAEQKKQSEMYELLNDELELTEEEFEKLFRGKNYERYYK